MELHLPQGLDDLSDLFPGGGLVLLGVNSFEHLGHTS